jgi:hypothetical protein
MPLCRSCCFRRSSSPRARSNTAADATPTESRPARRPRSRTSAVSAARSVDTVPTVAGHYRRTAVRRTRWWRNAGTMPAVASMRRARSSATSNTTASSGWRPSRNVTTQSAHAVESLRVHSSQLIVIMEVLRLSQAPTSWCKGSPPTTYCDSEVLHGTDDRSDRGPAVRTGAGQLRPESTPSTPDAPPASRPHLGPRCHW